jgi:CsoR family transcriptional regulator, copper-sensing transcriptional repressor
MTRKTSPKIQAAAAKSPQGDILKRLARVEGQIRGIEKMVEEERYCIDVLTQLAAVHEALRAVARQLVERHMKTCVAHALKSSNLAEAERVSKEMGQLLNRFTR